MTLAEKISWYREILGINYEGLANLCGVSESLLRQLQKNTHIQVDDDGIKIHASLDKHTKEITRACKRLKIAFDLLDDMPKIIDESLSKS